MPEQGAIRSAFNSPADEFNGSGKRPIVFNIYAPDRVTPLLPDSLQMVLHVNPSSMQWTYTQHIERTQTQGGFVEAHWGASPTELSMEAVTGGFVRLYSGLSNITGLGPSSSLVRPSNMKPAEVGGTRRDTIAYDKFLDLLALYKSNAAIYDVYGNVAMQGQILMVYDGGSYWGWFTTFSVEETAEKPYQFNLTFGFIVDRERHQIRGVQVPDSDQVADYQTPANAGPETKNSIPLTESQWTNLQEQAEDEEFGTTGLVQSLNAPPASTPTTPAPQPTSTRQGRHGHSGRRR